MNPVGRDNFLLSPRRPGFFTAIRAHGPGGIKVAEGGCLVPAFRFRGSEHVEAALGNNSVTSRHFLFVIFGFAFAC